MRRPAGLCYDGSTALGSPVCPRLAERQMRIPLFAERVGRSSIVGSLARRGLAASSASYWSPRGLMQRARPRLIAGI